EVFVAATSTRAAEVPIRVPRFQWWKRAVVISSFCLVAAGLPLLIIKSSPIEPALALKAPAAVSPPDLDKETARTDSPPPAPASAAETAPAPTPPPIEPSVNERPSGAVSPAPPRPAAKPKEQPAPAPGKLAVSSPTSVDIYRDDAYLGSAPVTLDLPAGTQML